ncbi:unnamed protein product [Chironomus riparius]|uniref:Uncharacterized protein n=1 Tax=Chironomus riparius TaxID=315576 RepID=A0A9P0IRU7_9DIPT|nr:unnamed protein product [Chironomus riparius]
MIIEEYVFEEEMISNVTETEYDYYDDGNSTSTNFTTSTLDNSTLHERNVTKKEVYVIKATTYEIGILADVPDNDTTTDNGPVTRQQVDLTFYNTESNGTDVNFGDIPFPVKTTGLKGQVITGIAPVHIGAVSDINDVLKAIPFSGTIVNITQADTSFVHITRDNLTDTENIVHLNDTDTDLAQLPILNTVLLPDSFHEAYEDVN